MCNSQYLNLLNSSEFCAILPGPFCFDFYYIELPQRLYCRKSTFFQFLAASRAAALGIAIRRRRRRRIISHAQCKLQFSLQITILIVNYNAQCKLQCLM